MYYIDYIKNKYHLFDNQWNMLFILGYKQCISSFFTILHMLQCVVFVAS